MGQKSTQRRQNGAGGRTQERGGGKPWKGEPWGRGLGETGIGGAGRGMRSWGGDLRGEWGEEGRIGLGQGLKEKESTGWGGPTTPMDPAWGREKRQEESCVPPAPSTAEPELSGARTRVGLLLKRRASIRRPQPLPLWGWMMTGRPCIPSLRPGFLPDVQNEECGDDGVDPITEGLHPLLAERFVQVKSEELHAVSWGFLGTCGCARKEELARGGDSAGTPGRVLAAWALPMLTGLGEQCRAPTHKPALAPAGDLADVGEEDDRRHQQVRLRETHHTADTIRPKGMAA